MKIALISAAFIVIIFFSSCKDDDGPEFQECLTKYHFNNYEPALFDYSEIDTIIMTRSFPSGEIEVTRLHKSKEFLDTIEGELLPSGLCDPNLYIQDRKQWQYSDKNDKVRFAPEYRGTSNETSLFEAVVVFYVDQVYYRNLVAGLAIIGDTMSQYFFDSIQIGEYTLKKVWNNFGVYRHHDFVNDPIGSGGDPILKDFPDCYYSAFEGPVLFIYPDSSIIHLEAK